MRTYCPVRRVGLSGRVARVMSGSVHSSAPAKGLCCAGPGARKISAPCLSLSQPVPAGIRCTDWAEAVGPAASPRWPAPTVAPKSVGSRSLPAGLPVTDRGQAPPLLGCGPGVEPGAALLETADDALAVLDGVGVVVLELGVHPQHRQPDAADARQHPPVRRRARRHGGVAALGLEIGELG